MAGLSRSAYLASLQEQKESKIKTIARLVFLTGVLVIVPQLLLFALGLWIVIALLLEAVKAGIDLPDYK
jgi:hypothetical protein